jgi:hypothetical protein
MYRCSMPAFRQGAASLKGVQKSIDMSTCRYSACLRLGLPAGPAAVQAGGPGLSRAAFISGALRELSIALCRGSASLCWSGASVATRAAGRTPMRGLARPSAEIFSACLAPLVWVWGLWFGFA